MKESGLLVSHTAQTASNKPSEDFVSSSYTQIASRGMHAMLTETCQFSTVPYAIQNANDVESYFSDIKRGMEAMSQDLESVGFKISNKCMMS